MKPLTLTLLASIIILSLTAQKNTTTKQPLTNTIALGYSWPNIPALALSVDVEKGFFSPFGPLTLHYEKGISKRISLGLIAAYSKAKSKQLTEPGGNTYHYNIRLFTMLVNSNFYYILKPKVQLYSGAGIGFFNLGADGEADLGTGTPEKLKDAGSGFAFQLNVIGVKYYPNGKIGFAAEIGAGYNGILNIGLTYKL